MRRIPVALLVLVFAATSFSAPAPAADAWTKFGTGSWKKVKTTTKTGAEEMVEESRYSLTEVNADSYVLRIETSMGGNPLPATEVRFPRTSSSVPEWTWAPQGGETLEIDGKKLECTVSLGTSADKKSTWRVWEATVNGATIEVKSQKQFSVSGTSRSENSEVKKLSEKLTIGNKEITCWVREFSFETEGQKTATKFWESLEMPGITVRSETTTTAGAAAMKTVREVTEFEVK